MVTLIFLFPYFFCLSLSLTFYRFCYASLDNSFMFSGLIDETKPRLWMVTLIFFFPISLLSHSLSHFLSFLLRFYGQFVHVFWFNWWYSCKAAPVDGYTHISFSLSLFCLSLSLTFSRFCYDSMDNLFLFSGLIDDVPAKPRLWMVTLIFFFPISFVSFSLSLSLVFAMLLWTICSCFLV